MGEGITFVAAVFSDFEDFWLEAVEAYAALGFTTKDQWLALLKDDLAIITGLAAGDAFKGAIVENHAVLQDFNEGSPVMFSGTKEDFFEVLDLVVRGTGNKGALGAHGQEAWVNGVRRAALWARLGLLAQWAGWAILPFGQTIDLVIKEQNFNAVITTEKVHQVITTDGESVAVTGD